MTTTPTTTADARVDVACNRCGAQHAQVSLCPDCQPRAELEKLRAENVRLKAAVGELEHPGSNTRWLRNVAEVFEQERDAAIARAMKTEAALREMFAENTSLAARLAEVGT